MKDMTAPIQELRDGVSRWTAQTVGMDQTILDRMERAVAKVRERFLAQLLCAGLGCENGWVESS